MIDEEWPRVYTEIKPEQIHSLTELISRVQ